MGNEFDKKYISETLEEAIKREYETRKFNSDFRFDPQSFKLGAKWQQERSYSEEDMRKAFIAGGNSQIESDDDYGTEYRAYMEEWFSAYKKK